ncbi:MAG: OsmC family protein [Burkholderiaceae bacterium]
MKVTVTWNAHEASDSLASPMSFIAATGSGHLVAMDGAPAGADDPLGGRNLAPRPMEMVLAGTGGCTAYDVVLILKRGRNDIRHCEVRLEAERAPEDPKIFTKIHFHFVVAGHRLRREVVQRAIALSHDKYCSASVMLGKSATLSYDFEIVETGPSKPQPETTASMPSTS